MASNAASLALAILIGTAGITGPAAARDWPETGGWSIAEIDDGCGMLMEYEGAGETQLAIILHTDGMLAASLTNTNWSAQDGASYDLTYILNGTAYKGNATGMAKQYESRKGFVGKFNPTFLTDLAAGSGLRIMRGDVLVDDLSLSGSAAAIAVLKRCVASVAAVNVVAQRKRDRLAHIPEDPFVVRPTVPIDEPKTPPAPTTSPSFWVSTDDYPAKALRENRTGETHFDIEVGNDGHPRSCSVTKSSGHTDLDNLTCGLVMRRARFNPANDSDGTGIQGKYSGRVGWAIP